MLIKGRLQRKKKTVSVLGESTDLRDVFSYHWNKNRYPDKVLSLVREPPFSLDFVHQSFEFVLVLLKVPQAFEMVKVPLRVLGGSIEIDELFESGCS